MYRNYTQTGCFWICVLFHCCKQSIQVSHIHYAYAIIIIFIIISFVIILIIVVINILFIHKSWQQIRHGDAHDSRTQNSKAVQKNEFIFTISMCVCLPFCQSHGCTEGCFISCTSYRPDSISTSCFDTDLIHCSVGGTLTQPPFFCASLSTTGLTCAFKMTCPDFEWLAEHFAHQYSLRWPVIVKVR